MIWILATRGAATKLRAFPYTETPVDGVHSIVYKPSVEAVPVTGATIAAGELGTFGRGLHALSGVLFSYDGSIAETLFDVDDSIDLIIRYRSAGARRVRTITDVLFVGTATVTVPSIDTSLPPLIGVPFRVQIPQGQSVAEHVFDSVDS